MFPIASLVPIYQIVFSQIFNWSIPMLTHIETISTLASYILCGWLAITKHTGLPIFQVIAAPDPITSLQVLVPLGRCLIVAVAIAYCHETCCFSQQYHSIITPVQYSCTRQTPHFIDFHIQRKKKPGSLKFFFGKIKKITICTNALSVTNI